ELEALHVVRRDPADDVKGVRVGVADETAEIFLLRRLAGAECLGEGVLVGDLVPVQIRPLPNTVERIAYGGGDEDHRIVDASARGRGDDDRCYERDPGNEAGGATWQAGAREWTRTERDEERRPDTLYYPVARRRSPRASCSLFLELTMPVIAKTALLLVVSNCFMTFAWYAHLKNLHNKPLYIAIFASWGIALFEYAFQVPANRIGSTQLELGQLKILQEVITLSVFVP